MAAMIPNNIDEFKTDGEKRFHRFLESVAKPDLKYTIWYQPDIEERAPNLISSRRGGYRHFLGEG